MSTRLTVTKTMRIEPELYREIEHFLRKKEMTFTELTVRALQDYLAEQTPVSAVHEVQASTPQNPKLDEIQRRLDRNDQLIGRLLDEIQALRTGQPPSDRKPLTGEVMPADQEDASPQSHSA